MIDYTTGDILKDEAEALVNTVNTVGVMGKGIALQFKRRFPGNFEAYRGACKNGDVEPGAMFVWPTGELTNPQFIINFPTKRHWKSCSRLEDIEAGLRSLRQIVTDLQVTSIAVPPLGCGHGGLAWSVVRPLINHYLRDLEGVVVRVYEPAGSPEPASAPANPRKPRLTPHRAAMILAFARYLQPGFTLGRVEAQKLMYFLKVCGAPYDRLHFTKGPYGPYADGIRHVLNDVEGHLIHGFRDADAASTIQPLGEAVLQAKDTLAGEESKAFRDALEKVASLIAGFDDSFGLELLASVHWAADREERPARNASEATRVVHDWSDRKRRKYTAAHVHAAWRRLEKANLVTTTVADPGVLQPRGHRDSPVVVGDDLEASAL